MAMPTVPTTPTTSAAKMMGANTARMNGHFHFHYDEALGRGGLSRQSDSRAHGVEEGERHGGPHPLEEGATR